MTDARFPERWITDPRVRNLSNDGFRAFMIGLAWSVSSGSEGWLTDNDLDDMPRVRPEWADEVVRAGLWEKVGDRWFITVFEDTQTKKSVLEAAARTRRLDRERKALKRAEGREEDPLSGRNSRRTSGRNPQESESDSASASSEEVTRAENWSKDQKPDDEGDWPETPRIPGSGEVDPPEGPKPRFDHLAEIAAEHREKS